MPQAYSWRGPHAVLKFRQDKVRAQALASTIATQVSATLLRDKRQTLSVNKITRVLEKTFVQVRSYQTEQRMGFLRRSLFANAFQWALKELGYPQDFIATATQGLVFALSGKPGTSASKSAP